MTGAFAQEALRYNDAGVMVIPVGGDDGKKPLVNGFTKWEGQSRDTIRKWDRQFPGANLGLVTGKVSGITVVDVDDPDALPAAIERFGDSPLTTATPSGGFHLVFESMGERNFTRIDGQTIDIRGEGGFAVAPPSARPDGRCYRRVAGVLSDLQRLPTIKPDALPSPGMWKAAKEGSRSNSLFNTLRLQARRCHDWDDFMDVARTINDDYLPPLHEDEVLRIAQSVWGYLQRGQLWDDGQSRAVQPRDLTDRILARPHGAEALALDMVLQHEHGARRKPFAVTAKAMEAAQVIPDWDHRKYTRATKALIEVGRLKYVSGKGTMGSPRKFVLVQQVGTESVPNINNTLPPQYGGGR